MCATAPASVLLLSCIAQHQQLGVSGLQSSYTAQCFLPRLTLQYTGWVYVASARACGGLLALCCTEHLLWFNYAAEDRLG